MTVDSETHQDWKRRREAARKYQPKRIRLLLVAESPPAARDRYFCFEQLASADFLFEAVCEVLFESKPRHDKVPYLEKMIRPLPARASKAPEEKS